MSIKYCIFQKIIPKEQAKMRILNFQNAICILLLISALSACQNSLKTKQQTNVTEEKQITNSIDTVNTKTESNSGTWIDDFKIFRDAAYYNDVNKLKKYFNFPVNTDSSQLFIGLTQSDEEAREAIQKLKFFTEADLKRYHKNLFHPAFMKSLLKVKSAELFKTGESSSPKFSDKDGDYQMHVTYNGDAHTLTLDLAYFSAKDENGDYVSEGECNLIYEFDVIEDKYIRFKKVDMAG